MVSPEHARLLAALLLCLAPSPARTQTPAGDVSIEKYLSNLTDQVSARPLNGLTTRAQWEQARPRLRQEYFDMLGLWPLLERTPLYATVTGTLDRSGVAIEKLHFQSRPGLYVTANLYRPKAPAGRLPAVLYLCGHSNRGRDGNKTAYQDHGLWFATNGYVCLVLDSLQLGEIPGVHHGTYSQGRWWWQALGYTPAGVECWNGVRGIDYLVSRADVDPERIGVTGISGGGAATFWVAAADDRVKCSVPVSGMSDLESYVKHKVINGHCDCMFLVNTYGWEWTTIAGLIAPRPMLFANSDNDSIFPMDGNRRIMERLRRLYASFGKPELLDEYVSIGGHAYRPDLRIAAFQWINRHLKQETGEVRDAIFETIPGKELRVFPDDKDVPKDARNGSTDQTFVSAAQPPLPEPGRFAEWKAQLVRQLRDRVFRPFPDQIGAIEDFRPWGGKGGMLWYKFSPMPNVMLGGTLYFTENAASSTEVETLLVLGDDETENRKLYDWLKANRPIENRFELQPRGIKRSMPWTRKSPPNYVERAHALLGWTVDTGRVWDVAATARSLQRANKPGAPLRVVGRGQMGIIAAYAALFEPAIKEVVLIDPPTSHRDGPIFLNVLRILDIPDAVGLLAPDTAVTLVNARDKAFDRSAEIFGLAGVEAKLQRK